MYADIYMAENTTKFKLGDKIYIKGAQYRHGYVDGYFGTYINQAGACGNPLEEHANILCDNGTQAHVANKFLSTEGENIISKSKNMNKFKVGDKIRGLCEPGIPYAGTNKNWEGYVTVIYDDEKMCVSSMDEPGRNDILVEFKYFELISKSTNNMGLKEKFVLGLTSEPKKSFRKAGITDGDDLLTEEGQTIFLTWLLHTVHADEFKASVVDGILEEQKEEDKKE